MTKLLTVADSKRDYADHVLAAKNIRRELKDTFRSIKFSVRSDSCSMSDSVRISWTDGPTEEQVQNIVNKYQEGSFDGMDDSYNYNSDRSFTDKHGGSKYIFTERSFSPSLVQTAITYLWHKFSIEAPRIGPEAYFNGSAYNIPVLSGGNYNHNNNVQSYIYRQLRKVSCSH